MRWFWNEMELETGVVGLGYAGTDVDSSSGNCGDCVGLR